MDKYTNVIATLGQECRDWPTNATDSEIKAIIKTVSRPGDVTIYTDGSVQRGRKSGWAFSARADGRTICEQAGAFEITTSSMCMEVKAISEALQWLQSQPFTHAVVATDSMSTLSKIQRGQIYADWVGPIFSSHLRKLTWLFCPGHAGVKGNERADWLAGSAQPGDASLLLDPPTVLGIVREELHRHTSGQPESFTLKRLQESGVPRGAGRQSTAYGTARRVSNQQLMGTISKPTLRWMMRRGTEQIWVCPDCYDVNSSPR